MVRGRADGRGVRTPPLLRAGADFGNIFTLRTPMDAAGIYEALSVFGTAVRIVIVGSSFIGMEAAAYLALKKITGIVVVGMEPVSAPCRAPSSLRTRPGRL